MSGQDVRLSRGISRRWLRTRLLSPRNCALPAPCERSVSSSCVTSTKVSCSRTVRWQRPTRGEGKSDSLRHSQFPVHTRGRWRRCFRNKVDFYETEHFLQLFQRLTDRFYTREEGRFNDDVDKIYSFPCRIILVIPKSIAYFILYLFTQPAEILPRLKCFGTTERKPTEQIS